MPEIPLIEELTREPIPAGSILLVEYDSASQWYNASITITAGWLKTGGKVDYAAFSRSPDEIRTQLKRIGVELEKFEGDGKFVMTDFYTPMLGQKSKEKDSHSLKVADLSIYLGQTLLRGTPDPDMLYIGDDESTFARFNDEKSWTELEFTRMIPGIKARRSTLFIPLTMGVLSDWVYKRFESVSDGVIEIKLDESGEEASSLIRIRVMHNVHFDSRWHELKIGENFEVTLEK